MGEFSLELRRALREETGCRDLEYLEAPTRIPSGHETDVYALVLRGGPAEFVGPMIARRLPDSGTARAASVEAAVQEGLHAQGFPVPRVFAVRDANPAFVLMERLPGRSLADGVELEEGLLGRAAALARAARLSFRLPRLLGEWTARLLELDTEPVLRAMEARQLPAAAIGFERHLESFAERIERTGLRGYEAGLDWLHRFRPREPERLAVCHGDLAPNLLLEGERVTGVVDWSSRSATVASPAFEIANTRVMLQVPLPLPALLRGASAAYQRGLVRGYARALGRHHAPAPERLGYYEAWRRFRVLLGAGELWRARSEGSPSRERADPWSAPEIAARVAADFRACTGVSVELPRPPAKAAEGRDPAPPGN